MPIDKQLLEILCCPQSKVDVEELSNDELQKLNDQIEKGSVINIGGNKVEEILSEGLITVDKKTVYRIEDGIPVMLIDEGIPFQAS